MSNITDLKLVDLADKIKKKELSSFEVTNAFIERSEKNRKDRKKRFRIIWSRLNFEN